MYAICPSIVSLHDMFYLCCWGRLMLLRTAAEFVD